MVRHIIAQVFDNRRSTEHQPFDGHIQRLYVKTDFPAPTAISGSLGESCTFTGYPQELLCRTVSPFFVLGIVKYPARRVLRSALQIGLLVYNRVDFISWTYPLQDIGYSLSYRTSA